jgi:chromosome segregation ATPase
MSKLNIFGMILLGFLVFAQSAGLVYFVNRSQTLSKEIDGLRSGYEELTTVKQQIKATYADKDKELQAFRERSNALEKSYRELTEQHDALKQDRDNLLHKVKELLAEGDESISLQETLERAEAERLLLIEERDGLRDLTTMLKGEIELFEETKKQLMSERDKAKAAVARSKSQTVLTKLKNEVSTLQKGERHLSDKLKMAHKEIKELTKRASRLEAENELLTEELEENVNALKNNKESYAKAVKKNQSFEREIANIPEQYTEIARQNKRLIQETAQMHYNLGVFYTKNKEYRRAIIELEKAVEIDPDDANTHFNLGYIYAEYLVNRAKAIDHFKHFLRLAKSDDQDVDWVRKYLVTWEAFEGQKTLR